MSSRQVVGEYVASPTIDVDDPLSTRAIVEARLAEMSALGNQVMEMLIGNEGNGGLLGAMSSAISAIPNVNITAKDVDTSATAIDESGLTMPTFDQSKLVTVPTDRLDGIDFAGVEAPGDITVGLSWAEASLPTEVFTALKSVILTDLADGSTGINEAVETAIYNREKYRQEEDQLKRYTALGNQAGQLQHAFPSGVLISAQADLSMAFGKETAFINDGIAERQAKLAQDNRKSVILGAINLDQLIRQTRDGESTRKLDAAKALLQGAIQDFGERNKRFATYWEGKKAEVQAAAESIKAALDTNKGFVEVFGKEVEAYGTGEEATASKNKSKLELIAHAISNARNDLEAQIADANALITSYTSINSLKERLAAEQAQIANHCAIGLLSSVNVSASMGYSGSEHSSQSVSISTSLSESHSAEHDPDS